MEVKEFISDEEIRDIRDNPLNSQVGGGHYKGFEIQPAEFSETNRISFLPGCVIKRLCRFDKEGGKGIEDLDKAIHEIQLIKQIRYGEGL